MTSDSNKYKCADCGRFVHVPDTSTLIAKAQMLAPMVYLWREHYVNMAQHFALCRYCWKERTSRGKRYIKETR